MRTNLLAPLLLALAACGHPRPEPIVVTPAVRALHDHAVIADLHMDPIMHRRDLTRASEDGDVDLPRLRQAGVDLAGFGIVTEPIPVFGDWGFRTALWWWGWPADARATPLSRALAQLDAMDALVLADPAVRLVRTRADLADVRTQHALGIVASLEGALPLAGDPAAVGVLWDRGVRVVGLTHLRDNLLGGSGSPTVPLVDWYWNGAGTGLTERGRELLAAMSTRPFVVDLAHASPRTFDDVLAAWHGPVLVSHTAMAALRPGTRNLSDDQLRAVAARGGIVGVMAATNFLGSDHLSALADHLVHAARVMGVAHVSLGLDLDGMVRLPVEFHDVRDLPKLTQLLVDRGLAPADVERILGLNAVEFFEQTLP